MEFSSLNILKAWIGGAGYVQIGLPKEALKVFDKMHTTGHVLDQVGFVTVLTALIAAKRFADACKLFSQMANPNVVAFNVMISGHAQRGYEVEAIKYFQDMIELCVKPTRSTLGSVLSAIANLSHLELGLLVHAHSIKQGLDSNVYVGSSLINMYSKCHKMEAAKKVFDYVEEKNVVLWNSMLGGYLQNGYSSAVLASFFSMGGFGFKCDEFTYTSILSACGSLGYSELGQQLHSSIIKNRFNSNLFVGNALVDMYAKLGSLNEARQQFELIRNRDNISWNAIIVGYVQEEYEIEAFSMFKRMNLNGLLPDEVTLASILSACSNLHAIGQGRQVHCLSVKSGLETSLYVGGSLIDMYAKCGSLESSDTVFSCMNKHSVVSMNALISGYAHRYLHKSVILFQKMLIEGLKPSEITFVSILDACDDSSKLNLGTQIHCFIVKIALLNDDEFLSVSLLGMYMNCLRKTEASVLFLELPNPKCRILWTSIISGHTQNGWSHEALKFYKQMHRDAIKPDQATFASVLKASSSLASLRDGREIHSLIFHYGFNFDELTSSALVDMYAKCGDLRSSVQVFEEMGSNKNDIISWNSMIVGFAKNGGAENALKVFYELQNTNVKPDDVTFLGVLTACSHSGRVNEGRQIFDLMVNYYKIQPRLDHFACMVDLLGRWGYLKEAEEFIDRLNFEPGSMIWATLLGACKLHGDEMRGRRAAEKLIKLEPNSSSPYVLLCNIYAKSGNWDGANSLRREMKGKGVKKYPGFSWIVVGEKTNLFVAGDNCHPRAGEIYAVLTDLTKLMKEIFEVDSSCDDNLIE